MKEKIRGSLAMDLELANVTWTVAKWIKWTLNQNAGLIIEDGRVVGFETKPTTYTK